MKNALDQIVTGLALLLMPFIGLAASAHQAESGSVAVALLYGVTSLVVIVQLARLFWQAHRAGRLHRAR